MVTEPIEIWASASTANGSGGKTTSDRKGTLVLAALAEVKEMKPTREQIAEQTKLNTTLEVLLWKRAEIDIQADQTLYRKDKPFAILGPPIEDATRRKWTLYAKSI